MTDWPPCGSTPCLKDISSWSSCCSWSALPSQSSLGLQVCLIHISATVAEMCRSEVILTQTLGFETQWVILLHFNTSVTEALITILAAFRHYSAPFVPFSCPNNAAYLSLLTWKNLFVVTAFNLIYSTSPWAYAPHCNAPTVLQRGWSTVWELIIHIFKSYVRSPCQRDVSFKCVCLTVFSV